MLFLGLWALGLAVSEDSLKLVLLSSRHSIKYLSEDFSHLTDKNFDQDFGTNIQELTDHGRTFANKTGLDFRARYFGTYITDQNSAKVWVYADPSFPRCQLTAELFLSAFLDKADVSSQLQTQPPLQYDFSEGAAGSVYPSCGPLTGTSDKATGESFLGLPSTQTVQDYLLTFGLPLLDKLNDLMGCCLDSYCESKGLPSGCKVYELGSAVEWVGGYYKTYTGGWNDIAAFANIVVTQAVTPNMDIVGGELALEETMEIYQFATALYDLYKNKINMWSFANEHFTLILGLMEQAVTGVSVELDRVNSPVDSPFIWLVGHDVQVDWIRQAFGLSYFPKGWLKDASTVFVGAIVFELYEKEDGSHYVKIRIHMLAPQQIRNLDDPTEDDWNHYLAIPKCNGVNDFECPYTTFKKILLQQLNLACTSSQSQAFLRSLGSQSTCCSPHTTPGCDQPAIEQCLARFDDYCVDTGFDQQCVAEAITRCGAQCTQTC